MGLKENVKSYFARNIPWLLDRIYDEPELFVDWQRQGYHITRNHFYQPIPDTDTLGEHLWQKPLSMPGVDMNEAAQLQLAETVFPKYAAEWSYPEKQNAREFDFYRGNGFFESFDAEVLHSFIRGNKPSLVIEVGSGFSTFVSANACRLNAERDNATTELIAIEPYPKDIIAKGFPGLTQLIRRPLEEVEIETFLRLKDGDILFIDSSHIAKTGSDVNYLFHEILPRLNPGVLVHIHDIFLPAEYPKQWIFKDHHFFNEQYMLQSFLCFNSAFEVYWASHFMYLKHDQKLKELFKYRDLGEIGPGSFWIRRTR